MTVYCGNNRKVSTLIAYNKWKDHTECVPTQMQNIVHNIKIHYQMQDDYWFWLLNRSGQFSMNSAWNHIRKKHTEFNQTSVIWDDSCAPKMSTCSLLAKLNRLDTKDKINKWNNNIDQSCILCLSQNEDRNHLFFNCSYSRQLLEAIMQKLKISFGNTDEINQILEIMC